MHSNDSQRDALKDMGNYYCPVRDTPMFNVCGGQNGGSTGGKGAFH